MDHQSPRRRAYQTLILVSSIGLFVTTILIQSKSMQSMMPRSLMSSPSLLYRSQLLGDDNNVSPTTPRDNAEEAMTYFAEVTACALPIPPSRLNHDDGERNDHDNNTCVRFFPERFFATVARDFHSAYEDSKQQVKTEHPVVHMTRLPPDNNNTSSVLLHHGNNGKTQQQQQQQQQTLQYPSTLTYFHVRKCGGTTMFRSLSTKSLRQLPYHYKVNKYNRNMIQDLGIVKDIYHTQQQQQQQAVVFSFVRDPVIRFLSSIGQMIHMKKIKLFPECTSRLLSRMEKVFVEEHLMVVTRKEDPPPDVNASATVVAKSQALVQCMLNSIQRSIQPPLTKQQPEQPQRPQPQPPQPPQSFFNYIDQHLLPQAFELRARSLEYDVGIHLMDMAHIAPTLKSLVGAERQNRHARSSRVADYYYNAQGNHQYDGVILEPSILTDAMIRDICRIYAVDVLLLQSTRVSSTLCSTTTSSSSSLYEETE